MKLWEGYIFSLVCHSVRVRGGYDVTSCLVAYSSQEGIVLEGGIFPKRVWSHGREWTQRRKGPKKKGVMVPEVVW